MGKITGGLVILKGFGFKEEDGKLVLENYDAQLFASGIQLLNEKL